MSNWYDDIDVATLQRIKTYSAFCDYKSQNLMLQTLFEAMQKKIDEYKKTNREIAKDFAALRKQVPQWHDLRKDPNDLPERSGRYFVYTGGEPFVLDFDSETEAFGYWCLDVGDNYGVRDTIFKTVAEQNEDEVIAWCEIPKYTEE